MANHAAASPRPSRTPNGLQPPLPPAPRPGSSHTKPTRRPTATPTTAAPSSATPAATAAAAPETPLPPPPHGHATPAAYLAFRPAPPDYASPIAVSYLLNATAPAVAAANAVPVASPVEGSSLLLVPVPCACTGAGYYQHGAAYVIQYGDETYFTIANDTYQGLATCQALMAQNPAHDSLDLYPNITLAVPLRCACPSAAQAAAGVRYLVTYVLGWYDDSSTVADRFRADYHAVLDANCLTDDSTVYPFTTMLVPLKDPPTHSMAVSPEAPAPAQGPGYWLGEEF